MPSVPTSTSVPIGTSVPDGTSLPTSGPPPDPDTVVDGSGLTLSIWVDTDSVTSSGGFIDTLEPIGTTVHQFTQTLTKRPALIASDPTAGGRPSASLDGVNDNFNCTTWSHSIATNNRVWFAMVMKARSFVAGNSYMGEVGFSAGGVSPQVKQDAAASANTNSANVIGQWRLFVTGFSATTDDFLQIGAASNRVTGGNAGARVQSGLRIGSYTNLSFFSPIDFLCLIAITGPTFPSSNIENGIYRWLQYKYPFGIMG